MRLGCLADDFTGATDLAGNLAAAGMAVVQVMGARAPEPPSGVDAVVVALKTRNTPVADAIRESVAAATWLRDAGAQQIYFKYCSTFDSTDEGNIGPVIEALMELLACPFTVVAPAFPDAGRTLYQGHLFVGDRLLNESGMEHHPLTPMTDPDIVRVLQQQTRRPVGLVPYAAVRGGSGAIAARMAALREQGTAVAVLDTICNDDLGELGAAVRGLPLVTGGSGLGAALVRDLRLGHQRQPPPLPAPCGHKAIVAGSCSPATNRQVQRFLGIGGPALRLDPLEIAAGADAAGAALRWSAPRLADGPLLVYTTGEASDVAAVQASLGLQAAGALIERTLAAVACGLVAQGVRQLVVAGGETAGACLQELGLRELQVGAPIAPGVPWCHGRAHAAGGATLHVALKSGNFGGDDFFITAFEALR